MVCNASWKHCLIACLTVLGAGGCHSARPVPPVPPTSASVQVGKANPNTAVLAGAVGTAAAEQMRDVRTGRVEEMIAGRFAGVDVVRMGNGEYSIRIRGVRSLMGDNEPLVVVDGIPSPQGLSNPLRDLAPQDVVRIDVLKDAASTAIYGVRGANGVILITTKRTLH